MKKHQLGELLRAVANEHPTARLVLGGSQALHGHVFSVPSLVELSMEADLLLTGEAFKARRQIEDLFGMESPYQRETGLYAHPVGLGTITLHPGWEGRLVPFGRDAGLNNVWALEIHDLAVSKLMAGREKDFEFLLYVIRSELVDCAKLLSLFLDMRKGAFANAVPDRLQKLGDHCERAGLRAAAAVREAFTKCP